MPNLFAYGTLMCDDIMYEVTGCYPDSVYAVLHGYSRRSVKGEHYPALVSDRHGRVEGLVYRDVPALAWERTDRYEGEMYFRQQVQTELCDGEILIAETYVFRPEFDALLEQAEWDLDEFLKRGKEHFLMHYRGFMSLKE
jgi:gamma-glutamylcyclotransferase (GGCT)/AIG2-like uncharacterized protein YtfP